MVFSAFISGSTFAGQVSATLCGKSDASTFWSQNLQVGNVKADLIRTVNGATEFDKVVIDQNGLLSLQSMTGTSLNFPLGKASFTEDAQGCMEVSSVTLNSSVTIQSFSQGASVPTEIWGEDGPTVVEIPTHLAKILISDSAQTLIYEQHSL